MKNSELSNYEDNNSKQESARTTVNNKQNDQEDHQEPFKMFARAGGGGKGEWSCWWGCGRQ